MCAPSGERSYFTAEDLVQSQNQLCPSHWPVVEKPGALEPNFSLRGCGVWCAWLALAAPGFAFSLLAQNGCHSQPLPCPTSPGSLIGTQPAGSFLSSKIDILEERFLGGDLC